MVSGMSAGIQGVITAVVAGYFSGGASDNCGVTAACQLVICSPSRLGLGRCIEKSICIDLSNRIVSISRLLEIRYAISIFLIENVIFFGIL